MTGLESAAETLQRILHGDLAAVTLFDFDGVLCVEWDDPEPNVHPAQLLGRDTAYWQHLTAARPLYLPTKPILGVVTGRLERYRRLGEGWLWRHGVTTIDDMRCCQHPTAQARPPGESARHKAAAYTAHPGAQMFIESRERHAQTIFDLTGRPVFCTETTTLLR